MAKKKEKKTQTAPAAAATAGDEKKEVSLKDKGNKAYQAGYFKDAIAHYSEAIAHHKKGVDSNNDLSVLYSNRAAAYNATKQYDLALEDAERVIKLRPDWTKGYFRKGQALEGVFQYIEAYKCFEHGVKLDAADTSIQQAHKNMTDLLNELKITEKQINASENPDQDTFDTLCEWLKDSGAKFPRLYLRHYEHDYRGVHALANIPKDDVVLYIPHDKIMTSEVAKESEICQKIIKSGLELLSTHSYLASYLLQEKKKKASYWKPYLDILPVDYQTMPIFFDDEKLALLKGSFSLQKIADRKEALTQEYNNICEVR